MSSDPANAWRCTTCGYVHRAAEPPEVCPVCGSPAELFEPFADAPAPDASAAVGQWQCLNCGYVHTGDTPPAECPVCGAPADRFEPVGKPEPARSGGQARYVVVVGAGIAGLAAVESLRQSSPDARITLISKEPHLPYYRLNLTRYLAGEISADDLPIHPQAWYDEQNVELKLGAEVSGLRLHDRAADLYGGESVEFDKLILTIGAHPFVPPFPGANRAGVTCLRTVDDAQQILDACQPGARCVCIGGGLLGLETAGALARRGADVTLLEGHGWLLPRQLNQTAGDILARHVATTGITLRSNARTEELVGDERVRGVLLQDGDTVSADLVVVATGIRSNSYLARLAGLDVNRGVVVDNHLRSSHPDVFAAGDVAEHHGTVYGVWRPSQHQGSIAGMNAVGLNAEFGGIPRSNTLKVLGLDLFSIGQVTAEDASFQVIDEETEAGYFRFVFRDSHLVGGVLLGDTSLTARVERAVEARVDFSSLLRARPAAGDVMQFIREHEA
jgi:NAD(P)H-nitrite reductase large subunit/rubredoxin